MVCECKYSRVDSLIETDQIHTNRTTTKKYELKF